MSLAPLTSCVGGLGHFLLVGKARMHDGICSLFSSSHISYSPEKQKQKQKQAPKHKLPGYKRKEPSVPWTWQETGLDVRGNREISVRGLQAFTWDWSSPQKIRPKGINTFFPGKGRSVRKWGLGIRPSHRNRLGLWQPLRPATHQVNETGILEEWKTLNWCWPLGRMAIVFQNSRKFALLAYQNWQMPGITNLSCFCFLFSFLMFNNLPFKVFHLEIMVSLKSFPFWVNVWNSGKNLPKYLCFLSTAQSYFWWLQTVRST